MTRTTDETMSLDERVEFCKAKRGDLFVSVHFNSGGSAEGIETYCLPPIGASSTADSKRRRTDDDRSLGNRTDGQNIWLAHSVQKALLRATGAEDRGVRRARFYVLRNATCPAVLIEGGFLSNRAEEKKILTATYRDQLAKAIAEGILNFKKSTESR